MTYRQEPCQISIPNPDGRTYRDCGQEAHRKVSHDGLIWLVACKYHYGQRRRDGYRTRAL